MRLAGQDLQAMLGEQRLLREVVRLARRCDGCPPPATLDAVLAGTGPVRPVVPVQRRRRAR